MAYKYNNITLRVGRSWTDIDGVTHPTNWSTWSVEEKTEKGIIWEDDPAPFDSRFYWSHEVPKSLEDVSEVDLEGQPVLDENGVQVVTKGLKSNAISMVKTQAGGMLAPTDWMIIKASEVADYVVPTDVTTYRAAVRQASNDIEVAITACETLDAFKALYDTPVDAEGKPTGNAPIANWPVQA